ncbi:MAG: glycosyltransferase, partial [Rhodospirillaceae bacterium]
MAQGLYVLHLSLHGLIRGRDLELGRDADTGGQTLYVVELARALGKHPKVERVDLLTRWIDDPAVDADYAREIEPVAPGVRIVRIPAGPPDYIRKELLWDHLDGMADTAAEFLRQQDRLPDIIHSHYADAGYVGVRLARLFGRPLVHTGHSLGRVKRLRLLAAGMDGEDIETRYAMRRRIEAEEETLSTADLVIASTHNEVTEQYELYDCYHPGGMAVIPPGVNLTRFHPPEGDETKTPLAAEIGRFLRHPRRPMVLAIARPDERKNLPALVEAFGNEPKLRARANLVIVPGTRDDIGDMDEGSREV